MKETNGSSRSVGRKIRSICMYSEREEILLEIPNVLYTAKSV